MNNPINLSDNLKKLADIANWFDEQQSVDVEEGLEKVKQAARLIKESKQRLKAIENEFDEIKKDIDADDEDHREAEEVLVTTNTEKPPMPVSKDEVTSDDIPF